MSAECPSELGTVCKAAECPVHYGRRPWAHRHVYQLDYSQMLCRVCGATKPAPEAPEPAGLYGKYLVERTDGRGAPGQKHDGCRYFVLDRDHDPHAAAALRAYADSCRAEFPALAADLAPGCPYDTCPSVCAATHPGQEHEAALPAPVGAQEPADPPRLEEVLIEHGARAMYEAIYRADPASPYGEWEQYAGTPLQALVREGIAAALPILRAGIEQDLAEKSALEEVAAFREFNRGQR